MEYHLWLYEPKGYPIVVPDYYATCQLIRGGVDIINSACITLFTTSLLDLGYRLFVHFPNGECVEVKYGVNPRTGRYIRPQHNLEFLLLAGEFGPIENE